jgi:hypothetical protein
MNLFRSEEHALRWARERGHEPGETIAATKLWELADAWWHDRLDAGWRPHTREQNQAILDSLGLTTPFWQLS